MELGTIIGGKIGEKARNVSLSFGPEEEVISTRSELLKEGGLATDAFVRMYPKHGAEAIHIHKSNVEEYRGKILGPPCDALITQIPYLGLECDPADCGVYILFYKGREKLEAEISEKEQHLLSVVHSGRDGSIKRILEKTICKGAEILEIPVKEYAGGLKVIQAPMICGHHYRMEYMKVPEEDAELWKKHILGSHYLFIEPPIAKFSINGEGKIGIDFQKYNYERLLAIGVRPENIELSDICTYESPLLFSHSRAEETKDGKHGPILQNGRFMVLGYLTE